LVESLLEAVVRKLSLVKDESTDKLKFEGDIFLLLLFLHSSTQSVSVTLWTLWTV